MLHLGGDTLTSTRDQDPRGGALDWVGDEAQGQGWSLAPLPDTLLLGMPEADAVRSLPLDGAALGSSGALDEARSAGSLVSAAGGERFGAALARVVTAGGADLWVGAPGATGGLNDVEAGAVYRFAGRGDGLQVDWDTDRADLRLISEAPFDHLGERLAACPDLDGDGDGELLLAAGWDSTGAALGGQVYALLSSERAGLGAEALTGELSLGWVSAEVGAQLGRALSCAHDLSGEGTVDLVLGAPFADPESQDAAGAVYLLWGEALPQAGAVEAAAGLTLGGGSAGDHFGWALASGDLDGDGQAELVVGAPGAGLGAGAVEIFAGVELAAGRTLRDAQIDGEVAGDHLGAALCLGDFDGDGLGDLAVGAPRHIPSGEARHFASGAVYLFRGASPLSAAFPARSSVPSADATLQADEQFLQTGQAMACGPLSAPAASAEPGDELWLLLTTDAP